MLDITTGRLQAYVASRLKKVSSKTVFNEIVVIKEMFNYACRWGYLKYNPAEYLDRPKVEKPEIEILEPNEIEKFLGLHWIVMVTCSMMLTLTVSKQSCWRVAFPPLENR